MKAAIYKRVSTDEQADHGTSLDDQEEILRAFCAREKLEIYQVYTDDGWSGAVTDRPAFQKMLADGRAKKFDIIVVYNIRRFSRSLFDNINLVLREFQSIGLAFRSVTEPFDTSTPIGRKMFADMAGWGEYERENIRQQLMNGKKRRAREGKVMIHTVPYGYMKDKSGGWAIRPDQAKIYQKVVQWILGGLSTRDVVKKLNALNVPAWSGGIWKQGSLYGIMKGTIYLGRGTYAGEVFPVPPLITEARWKAVQEAMRGRRHGTQPYVKHFHLLRGLLHCRCGHRLYAKAKNGPNFSTYECLSIVPNPKPRYCGLPRAKQVLLDDAVWETVLRLVNDRGFLRQVLESNKLMQTGTMAVKEAEIAVLDKAIQDKRGALNRILDAYSQSKTMTVSELDAQAAKIKSEIANLEREKAGFSEVMRRHEKAMAAVKDLETLLAHARRRIKNFTDAQKREFLLRTVEKIMVSHDGQEFQLEIHFKFQVSKDDPSDTGNADSAISMVLSALPHRGNWRKETP